jgi:hypothetical protein
VPGGVVVGAGVCGVAGYLIGEGLVTAEVVVRECGAAGVIGSLDLLSLKKMMTLGVGAIFWFYFSHKLTHKCHSNHRGWGYIFIGC